MKKIFSGLFLSLIAFSTYAITAKIQITNNTDETFIVRISNHSNDNPLSYNETLDAKNSKKYIFHADSFQSYVEVQSIKDGMPIIKRESDCVHANYTIDRKDSRYEIYYHCTL